MPTYEYECTKCGHGFERFQSMTDEPVKRCPECRCKVRRVFGTGAGILFKGSGFYQTDYRSKSYRDGESKAKSAASSGDDAGSKKAKSSDTTTAKKPETATKT